MITVEKWATINLVSPIAIDSAKASLPAGAELQIKGGDLVAIKSDGETISLSRLCPDLIDLLKPQGARQALSSKLTLKPLPKVSTTYPRLEDVPTEADSAKNAVAKTLLARQAFSEGL